MDIPIKHVKLDRRLTTNVWLFQLKIQSHEKFRTKMWLHNIAWKRNSSSSYTRHVCETVGSKKIEGFEDSL